MSVLKCSFNRLQTYTKSLEKANKKGEKSS